VAALGEDVDLGEQAVETLALLGSLLGTHNFNGDFLAGLEVDSQLDSEVSPDLAILTDLLTWRSALLQSCG
jgi:hypothetical protein